MQRTEAENRFFQSTRGQVVSRLRRHPATVDELARELGLTKNGVRVHLTSLERDGLVARGEPRAGTSKPAATYVLTQGADRLFTKPYGIVLELLLKALAGRVPAEATRDALIDVGHVLAAMMPAPAGSIDDRIQHAVDVINDFGGLAEVVDDNGNIFFQSRSCPLAHAVEGDPDACCLVEALLSDIIGVPVHQACDRGGPHCRFAIATHRQTPGADVS